MQTTTKWTARKVLAAHKDLTELLSGHPDGPLGYKAGVIRSVLDVPAVELSRTASALMEKYQREIPGPEGKVQKMPTEHNGQPISIDLWAKDPAAYRQEERETLAVEIELSFPVRFTYEELIAHREPVRDISGTIASWQGIHGTFWVHLSDIIDPPTVPITPSP